VAVTVLCVPSSLDAVSCYFEMIASVPDRRFGGDAPSQPLSSECTTSMTIGVLMRPYLSLFLSFAPSLSLSLARSLSISFSLSFSLLSRSDPGRGMMRTRSELQPSRPPVRIHPGAVGRGFLIRPYHTVDYDPFIKSQLARRISFWDLNASRYGHVTRGNPGGGNPRRPPCGTLNMDACIHPGAVGRGF